MFTNSTSVWFILHELDIKVILLKSAILLDKIPTYIGLIVCISTLSCLSEKSFRLSYNITMLSLYGYILKTILMERQGLLPIFMLIMKLLIFLFSFLAYYFYKNISKNRR